MKTYYYRHRPHIQPPGFTLFVTFRLFGSLPKHILKLIFEEYNYLANLSENIKSKNQNKIEIQEIYHRHKRLFDKYDNYLHNSKSGPTFLSNEVVAKVVSSSIHFFDQNKYDLLAYCIMSNHVHIVFTPLQKNKEEYHSLEKIMHSIKSFTANKANKIIDRKDKNFWTHESYDHYSRNGKETERIISYVLNNPVKAGLVDNPKDWPWNYYKYW